MNASNLMTISRGGAFEQKRVVCFRRQRAVNEGQMRKEHLQTSSKRIAWVDTCKGIGILLVVLGHTTTGTAQRLIYLFHMPLFFFLSGYLHMVKSDLTNFLRKKAIHLVLPYFSFLLLFSPIQLVHYVKENGGQDGWIKGAVDLLWGGTHLRGLLGVFWFITCLFFTQQSLNYLVLRMRTAKVALIVFLSLVLSYANSTYFPQVDLPLGLHVSLAAMPFMFVGYLWHKSSIESGWIDLVSAGVIAFAIATLLLHVPLEYDMKDCNYGVPILSLGVAFSCIVWAIKLAKWASRVATLEAILGSIGNASMGIMFLHQAVMYIPGVKRITGGHPIAQFVLLSTVSYGLTRLLMNLQLARAFLMGSEPDFVAITKRFPPRSRTHAEVESKGTMGSQSVFEPE